MQKILTSCFVLVILASQLIANEVVILQPHENRTKVAIIDTGLYLSDKIRLYVCNDKHYDFTKTSINDTHGHGSNIAAIIVKNVNPNDICIKIIKFTTGEDQFEPSSYLKALDIAVHDSTVKYINISAGGEGNVPDERNLILEGLRKNKNIIVSAGNNNRKLSLGCNVFPACYFFLYTNFRVIGNGSDNLRRNQHSNYGLAVTHWQDGMNVCAGETENGIQCHSGTSQATALHTNFLIRKDLKARAFFK